VARPDDPRHEGEDSAHVTNSITGGVFFQAVIQGRNITVQLPRQITPALAGLPIPSAAFIDCGGRVASLLKRLAPDNREHFTVRTGVAPVTAVSGLAGVGKTELAVQAAARALKTSGWFPGGVLFIDVFGYDPERRLSPERALDGLLRALGIPGEHIPTGTQDRQRLYRSVLGAYAEQGRRILVVIDNASSVEQARSLLPTDGTTAALVTSRHTLDGLDARLVDVGILDQPASIALLDLALRHARGNDDTRITDQPEAAATIARLCAGLPLALRMAAASLAAMPTRPAADLAIALESEHSRLDKLRRPDRALRAAFDLSYRLLNAEQARLFRLLPINPGPDISTDAAAHLADATPDQVADVLEHLADAHLLESETAWGRWRMHDLIRIYAAGCGQRHASEDLRDQATLRLIDFYDHATKAAVDRLYARTTSSLHFPDQDDALEWLETERGNLTGIVTVSAESGHESTAVSLAADLCSFFHRRRHLEDWVGVATTALEASRRIGDRDGEGALLANLGSALKEKRRFKEAIDLIEAAVTCFREAGDVHNEGAALCNLGATLVDARKFEEAISVLRLSMSKLQASSPQAQTVLLSTLGLALTSTRRYEEAVGFLVAAVSTARQSWRPQT
jgi:tetratricopeptide (TPR) repeat protein